MNNKSKRYLVTNEEVLVLVKKWQTADKDKKNILASKLVSCLDFLVNSRIKAHKGLPFYEDLFQEGRLGIIRALEDFRFERGKNFFIFAIWHIQTKIRRFLTREMRRREIPMGDTIIENVFETPDMLEAYDNKKAIIQALNFLPDNDRRVLVMRFGFDGEEPRTFQQIGKVLGISKQRAQQIEAGALRRLRNDYDLEQFIMGDI